eukprot:jgi/Tetstr1/463150/TSEL_008084.t1
MARGEVLSADGTPLHCAAASAALFMYGFKPGTARFPLRCTRTGKVSKVTAGKCSTCEAALVGRRDMYCAGCETAAYCSRECQASHWRSGGHKAVCRAFGENLLSLHRVRREWVNEIGSGNRVFTCTNVPCSVCGANPSERWCALCPGGFCVSCFPGGERPAGHAGQCFRSGLELKDTLRKLGRPENEIASVPVVEVFRVHICRG